MRSTSLKHSSKWEKQKKTWHINKGDIFVSSYASKSQKPLLSSFCLFLHSRQWLIGLREAEAMLLKEKLNLCQVYRDTIICEWCYNLQNTFSRCFCVSGRGRVSQPTQLEHSWPPELESDGRGTGTSEEKRHPVGERNKESSKNVGLLINDKNEILTKLMFV